MVKRKKAKTRKKVKKDKSSVYFLFGLGGFLVIVLIGLVLSSLGFFEEDKGERMFSIEDECSLVMGNLIHQIRDSGDCQIKCINECGLDDREFNYVEFAVENNSCNSCDCYCK